MALELWAGPECTVNRVGDQFNDQLQLSGFADRPQDIDRLASLGITRMRFPLLWERTATAPGQHDWRWAAARLARLEALGVQPIAGLLHHGSGPPWTNLLDPAFPALFADYAGAVARQFPGIAAYTPVNEPLTTARFSALYGFWYPHRADDRSFVRAVLHQVRATVLAMQAIRKVNPDAMLVQTEDLGYTTCSPNLRYQADFENLRRWLTFDLLTGRVSPEHGLWDYLTRHGATDTELRCLMDAPCPPDVLGINYYLTSERHLDARVRLYPPILVGGNGRDRYADVETARVSGQSVGGFELRLREACSRYARTTALTEVHLGCTREEQLRWLHQAWQAAQQLRLEGHDVLSVTCWAAFGSFDWDSLVTQRAGHYESGVWNVRAEPPRPTALAKLARRLAKGMRPDHPVLEDDGWWQRPQRLKYPPRDSSSAPPLNGRPILVVGASAPLENALLRICLQRGLACRLLALPAPKASAQEAIDAATVRWQPWAILHAVGDGDVDEADAAGLAHAALDLLIDSHGCAHPPLPSATWFLPAAAPQHALAA